MMMNELLDSSAETAGLHAHSYLHLVGTPATIERVSETSSQATGDHESILKS